MNRKLFRILALAAAGLLPVLHCTAPNGGTGSQIPNSAISGVIYNANGTPAAGATVRFYPVDYNPQSGSLGKVTMLAAVASKDSVTTDASGRYTAMLDSGSYNLLASGDTTLAFQDSLLARKGDTAHPADTLRAPGAIKGMIKMQGSDLPTTVFIIFIGTGSVDVPQDSTGNFLIRNLAQGSYHVRFLSTLDKYTPLDTNLTVTAGKVDTLAQPIQLQYTGIPVPAGLRIQYDTTMQVVTLIWNKPTTGSPIKGYEVYRNNVAYNALPLAINAQIVTDTVYHDSTGVQDSSYAYYVAAVDTGNGVGGMSGGAYATILPAFSIKDTLFKIGGYGWLYDAEKDAHGNYVILNGTAYSSTPAEIERFSASGTLINSWNLPGGVQDAYTFNCIAVGDSNTIFDISKSNMVIRFDTMGTILSQFQYPGSAGGVGVLQDTLYIADAYSHIVRAYSITGDSLFSWGSQGSGTGQFGGIGFLMTDSTNGNIFIEDGQGDYNRIQVFDRNGNYKAGFSLQSTVIGINGGELGERNDTILICNSSSMGAFAENGSLVFRFGALNSTTAYEKAVFDNVTGNIVLFNWTGEVINVVRK